LVTKVHHEAKVRAAKGYTILYVGHAGHDEAVGTLAVAPERIRLVEHEEELAEAYGSVEDPSKVALLAQTTLALHDWEGIMTARAVSSPSSGRRRATISASRRPTAQAALTAIATCAGAVVVIGSANSSNTIAPRWWHRALVVPSSCASTGPTSSKSTSWPASVSSA
jgi:4-hydroxy-3-methylbut-2-enyl diphosphate reductase